MVNISTQLGRNDGAAARLIERGTSIARTPVNKRVIFGDNGESTEDARRAALTEQYGVRVRLDDTGAAPLGGISGAVAQLEQRLVDTGSMQVAEARSVADEVVAKLEAAMGGNTLEIVNALSEITGNLPGVPMGVPTKAPQALNLPLKMPLPQSPPQSPIGAPSLAYTPPYWPKGVDPDATLTYQGKPMSYENIQALETIRSYDLSKGRTPRINFDQSRKRYSIQVGTYQNKSKLAALTTELALEGFLETPNP